MFPNSRCAAISIKIGPISTCRVGSRRLSNRGGRARLALDGARILRSVVRQTELVQAVLAQQFHVRITGLVRCRWALLMVMLVIVRRWRCRIDGPVRIVADVVGHRIGLRGRRSERQLHDGRHEAGRNWRQLFGVLVERIEVGHIEAGVQRYEVRRFWCCWRLKAESEMEMFNWVHIELQVVWTCTCVDEDNAQIVICSILQNRNKTIYWTKFVSVMDTGSTVYCRDDLISLLLLI